MKITQVSSTPGGGLQSAKKTWTLSSPAGQAPALSFRQVLYMRLSTGSVPGRIVLDEQSTRLKGNFQSLTYDVLKPPDPILKASTEGLSDGPGVRVELDAPRQVERLVIRSGVGLSTSDIYELYRLDGDARAEKATSSVTAEFPVTIAEQKIVQDEKFPVLEMFAMSPAKDLQADEAGFSDQPFAVMEIEELLIYQPEPFVDRRFAILRRPPGGGDPLAFTAEDVAGLQVIAYPAASRLGLAAPGQEDRAIFFWSAPGEVRQSSQGEFDLSVDLASALQRLIDAILEENDKKTPADTPRPLPLPAQVDVSLVIASDAPCKVDLQQLEIGYYLETTCFPDRQEKQTLRYSGGHLEAQRVQLELPKSASIRSAELKIAPSFGDAGWVGGLGGDAQSGPAAKFGVEISVQNWAAQSLETDRSMLLHSLSLGVMGLVEGTELQVGVYVDWQSSPNGELLAESTIKLGSPGKPAWITFALDQPIVLAGDTPSWALVKARQGRAIWLAETGEAPEVHVVKPSDRGQLPEVQSLSGYRALIRLAAAVGNTPEAAAGSGQIMLAIGGQAVPASVAPESAGDGQLYYDLKTKLNNYLNNAPASSQPVAVPLEFSAALRGFITVYPPKIKFDLL